MGFFCDATKGFRVCTGSIILDVLVGEIKKDDEPWNAFVSRNAEMAKIVNSKRFIVNSIRQLGESSSKTYY
jgi:hypothetical protein